MTTEAPAHAAGLAMHREPDATRAPRTHGVMTVICIAAFIMWCALPAVIWSARLGLSALSDHPSTEPERLPSSCVVPDTKIMLVLTGDKHHGANSRHRAALLGR